MIRVMFVCWGNICRSPMAEFIFQDLVNKRGIGRQFDISSSAISDEEIWNGVGSAVYPPAKRELAKHGISCEGKRAVQLTRADYIRYDYIICMEDSNIRHILSIFGGDPEEKVYKLLKFTEEGGNIADPWYTGDFEGVYEQIVRGLEGFLEYLSRNGQIKTHD